MKLAKGYTGVYRNTLENGDVAYHITWKWDGKKEWLKIGLHSENIRLAYCKKRRSAIMVALRNGEAPQLTLKNKTKITLHSVALDFFNKKQYKKSTHRTLWGRYINHTYPALGALNIMEINEDKVTVLFANKKNDNNLSDKSVQLIMEQLSSIINYAIKTKVFNSTNPCKKIKIKKVDNARTRFLSEDEVKELLRAVETNADVYLFVLLSLSTGARLSDMYHVQKKHFNLNNRTVTIKNSKGSSTYQAFLQKRVLMFLNLDGLEPNALLYSVSERSIQRYLKKVMDRLFNVGLDAKDSKNRVVVHTLRHTFASLLAIKGTPIYTIMKLMDHKNIEDTLRYAKLSPDNGREFVEGLF